MLEFVKDNLEPKKLKKNLPLIAGVGVGGVLLVALLNKGGRQSQDYQQAVIQSGVGEEELEKAIGEVSGQVQGSLSSIQSEQRQQMEGFAKSVNALFSAQEQSLSQSLKDIELGYKTQLQAQEQKSKELENLVKNNVSYQQQVPNIQTQPKTSSVMSQIPIVPQDGQEIYYQYQDEYGGNISSNKEYIKEHASGGSKNVGGNVTYDYRNDNLGSSSTFDAQAFFDNAKREAGVI